MPYMKFITVKSQYEGMHKWEDAPDKVAFLKNSHRHLFHLEVTIEVTHGDRELEFFMVKEFIDRTVLPALQINHPSNLGSCEDQALYICELLKDKYNGRTDRWIEVTVYEDGENGGTVTWIP